MPKELHDLSDHQMTLLFLLESAIDMAVRDINEDEVLRLMKMSYGRVVSKDIRRKSVTALDQRIANHIADWLYAAVINQEAWLNRVDAIGRPKKLMKLGSLDQLIREADKAMIKAVRRHKEPIIRDPTEVMVENLADGYTIVQMTTPEALDEESRQMQHCIGGGAYDKKVTYENYKYLSLRDEAGKSHVTIEICGNDVRQIKGKQNANPIKKYMDILIPFLQSKSLLCNIHACDLGYVVDYNRHWHPIDAIPENTIIDGGLMLRQTAIKSLPENLTVHGSLNLCGSDVEVLPKNLIVIYSLNIERTQIKEIPSCIAVGGSLIADHSSLEYFPPGLKIGHRNGGNVSLSDTRIRTLPPSLSVFGSLALRGLTDFELPESLCVVEDLFIEGTNLTNLPSSVKVHGHVHTDEGEMTLVRFKKNLESKRHSLQGPRSI